MNENNICIAAYWLKRQFLLWGDFLRNIVFSFRIMVFHSTKKYRWTQKGSFQLFLFSSFWIYPRTDLMHLPYCIDIMFQLALVWLEVPMTLARSVINTPLRWSVTSRSRNVSATRQHRSPWESVRTNVKCSNKRPAK